ncbi:mucin-6-like [Hypanus sabinus]|uniref:mucin-6-like n=1 Tax=Hypanus sabinus TaxID=79690 RepID=UPI0028C50F41|nr:mucin-6-like [Hypanus sabinus]
MDQGSVCSSMLNKVAPLCKLPKKNYIIQCQRDLYKCSPKGDVKCSCQTLSEYARQCSRLQQPVCNWRNTTFCSPLPCLGNQIYQECGSPCLSTCSNPQTTCDSYGTYGCFCPPGTFLDDISANNRCVPLSHCPCALNGKVYTPGDSVNSSCKACKCSMGKWNCIDLPCPGRCSIEGGSFVTTFDSRQYRYHGVCTYLLVKSVKIPDNGTIEVVFEKPGVRYSETQLTSVIYATNQKKIVISNQDVMEVNNELKKLPYQDGNIVIYRQSSSYIQVESTFGLEMQIQVHPFLQLYVTVDERFATTTHGDSIVSGTERRFCEQERDSRMDYYLLGARIRDILDRVLNILKWKGEQPEFVVHNVLKGKAQQAYLVLSADEARNYDEVKGAILRIYELVPEAYRQRFRNLRKPWDRRYLEFAHEMQIYFDRWCASKGAIKLKQLMLIEQLKSCIPEGMRTYSDEKEAEMLSATAKLADEYALTHKVKFSPSKSYQRGSRGGRESPPAKSESKPGTSREGKEDEKRSGGKFPSSTCYNYGKAGHIAPKCFAPKRDKGKGKVPTPTACIKPAEVSLREKGSSRVQEGRERFILNGLVSSLKGFQEVEVVYMNLKTSMLQDDVQANLAAMCVPGCVCPDGMMLNEKDQCVLPEDCPCEFSGVYYHPMESIVKECQKCICFRGKWECTGDAKCPSTCVIHGEGHVTTFDGKHYVFDGSCEYILVQDACSVDYKLPSFKIVSENIICGKKGVVCTKSIRIFLEEILIKLADGQYTLTPPNAVRHFKVVRNPLYLKFDFVIKAKLELTVIWNKNMNAYISITRLYEVKQTLCGLCGNYNGNVDDEYIAQSKYLVSNLLVFANSWKEDATCTDVTEVATPCFRNPYRFASAEKMCAIINSKVFEPCHKLVYRMPYYDNCVRDTCGCELVGNCECLCDAVAVYAKACIDAGVCIDWRTPDFCPVYCDYFNSRQLDSTMAEYAQNAKSKWRYLPCLCQANIHIFGKFNMEGKAADHLFVLDKIREPYAFI